MYVVVWSYRVLPESDSEFRQAYGSDGEWARFFRQDPSYSGTDLLASNDPGTYLTIDRWADAESYQRFISDQSEMYQSLDHKFELLTIEEELIFAGNDI